MNLNLTIEPAQGCLWAIVSGAFSMPGARDVHERILRACGEHGLQRVLIDIRELQGTLSTMDDFEWAVSLAAAHSRHVARGRAPVRFVILGHRPPPRPWVPGTRAAADVADDRFGETVMVNRGLDVRVTGDPTEAFEWLGLGRATADEPQEACRRQA